MCDPMNNSNAGGEVPDLVIRVDAGGALGAGHVMRMIALAQAYQQVGGRVVFLHALCPEGLLKRLVDEGFGEERIEAGKPGDGLDARQTLEKARGRGAEWVVVDGYQFGEDYHASLAQSDLKVIVLNDYGHCDAWNCDAVLDQNLGAESRVDRGSGGSMPVCLAGSRYALLRREVLRTSHEGRRPWKRVGKLLVTLGGVDQENATGRILDVLEHCAVDGLFVRVITGAGNPHRAGLLGRAGRHDLEIVGPVTDMKAQYVWADAIISAGGGTCWEWLHHGLPAAVVTLADNQEAVVANLAERNLALSLGWFDALDPSATSRVLTDWLNDPRAMLDQGRVGEVIDGRGAGRVARFLVTGMVLRSTEKEDCGLYYEWVNDPVVRNTALVRKNISWAEHQEWFWKRLGSPDAKLYVAEVGGEAVGQVRFERGDGERWEVSISLAPAHRSKGYAGKLLAAGLDSLGYDLGESVTVVARVLTGNVPSMKLFARAGFDRVGSEQEEIARFEVIV